MARENNLAELNTEKYFLYYIHSIERTHFGEAIKFFTSTGQFLGGDTAYKQHLFIVFIFIFTLVLNNCNQTMESFKYLTEVFSNSLINSIISL